MLKELQYPFDSQALLQGRKKLLKILKSDGKTRLTKRIAVLGGSTTSDIIKMMEIFLLDNMIEPVFYESEYAMYWEDAVFGNSELDAFEPDIIFIHTSFRNLRGEFPALSVPAEEVEAFINESYKRFEKMWVSLHEKFRCPIIQNNFDYPHYRLLGNMDATDVHGRVRIVRRLNDMFADYARASKTFYVNDLCYISAAYGLEKWHSQRHWSLFKYVMSYEAIPVFAHNTALIIKSIFGMNKKALVLDLDNTLWGGIVGDDGVEGIELGTEIPTGQTYTEFQEYLSLHSQMGVLLAINSKNDRENALAGLAHPDSKLHKDDFASIKANWDNKAHNLAAIASELSLGTDSFVFVDDNPAERAVVFESFPTTAVPEMTDPDEYIRILDRNGYFEITSLTEDDLKRKEMYKANAERQEMMESFVDYDAYLRGLEMTADIAPFSAVYIPRITQLTNKSNQFNLTTRRYTQEQIEGAASDPGYITLYGRLIDRFADNGVVSVVIGRIEGKELHIELWLMSCRVLKRKMENAMLDTLVAMCAEKGIEKIYGYYYPTAKNSMVKDLFGSFGFENIYSQDGQTTWLLPVEGYENGNDVIDIIKE